MYVTDWFATFLQAARLKDKIPEDTDSISMWKSVSEGKKSRRKDIILNIDRWVKKFKRSNEKYSNDVSEMRSSSYGLQQSEQEISN